MGNSIIVGGDNYGQDSSREHAAMLPMSLGVEAGLAKSFARIHKDNLFNYGIIQLLFADPTDFDKVERGDVLVLENVTAGIESGRFLVKARPRVCWRSRRFWKLPQRTRRCFWQVVR